MAKMSFEVQSELEFEASLGGEKKKLSRSG